MRDGYEARFQKSVTLFKAQVAHRMKKLFHVEKVINIEEAGPKDVNKYLDSYGDIDAICLGKNYAFGLSSRINYGNHYQCFTVRKTSYSGIATEFQKLKRAYQCGFLAPLYHVHAHFTKGDNPEFLYGAVCKMQELITYIDQGKYDRVVENATYKPGDLSSFYVVNWADYGKTHWIKYI